MTLIILGAGVCKFTAEVDGRLIEGVVKATEEARIDYKQAIQSGHSSFLIEEKLPDVFKVLRNLSVYHSYSFVLSGIF